MMQDKHQDAERDQRNAEVTRRSCPGYDFLFARFLEKPEDRETEPDERKRGKDEESCRKIIPSECGGHRKSLASNTGWSCCHAGYGWLAQNACTSSAGSQVANTVDLHEPLRAYLSTRLGPASSEAQKHG
jgi:hypothetical protein